MNPSASGWIPKLLDIFRNENILEDLPDSTTFYDKLRTSGFIYGLSTSVALAVKLGNLQLTKDEFTKINLFQALLYTYSSKFKNASEEKAIQSIINFYKNLEKGKKRWMHKLSLSHRPENVLENILAARLQEKNALIKKDTTSILTYALLYMDVLEFKKFLDSPKEAKEYAEQLESILVNICFMALRSKKKKDKYDLFLLELFESSSEYLSDHSAQDAIITPRTLSYLTEKDALEKKYVLDLCCMAIWDDRDMDASELQFLKQLAIVLEGTEIDVFNSIDCIKLFSEKNATRIKLFEYTHPVQQFYKQSTATVKTLILRNKNRLIREMEESGELMVLLGNSTFRELTKEEKNKVKEQLLDICKTIPSLTIFLLPGGTLLLPLLVKFIPKLLPSAFHENRIEVKKKNKD